MAWVMARMWFSLKLDSKEEPRWPEVPKLTRWAATAGSGLSGVVGRHQPRYVHQHIRRGRLAGSMLVCHGLYDNRLG
jgi:hypothetical protein